MEVQLVGLKATEQMRENGCIEVTPELMAATGARYSRNGEGLQKIMKVVAGKSESQAVSSIFRMVDYGHASIADMAPVAMFLDQISMYLVMKIWQWCPMACGQETSTRYVTMSPQGTVLQRDEYRGLVVGEQVIKELFAAYEQAYQTWLTISELQPELVNLPLDLQDLDPTPPEDQRSGLDEDALKQMLKRDRIVRNFAFDRSRYYLPMGAYTNFMMVMPARCWVELITRLLSWCKPEATDLGEKLLEKLSWVTPNLVRHAKYSDHVSQMMAEDECMTVEQWPVLSEDESIKQFSYKEPVPFCQIHSPFPSDSVVVRCCEHHGNRYTGFCEQLGQVAVRFGWMGLPLAEARDMNRHRPGSKYFPLIPLGFYGADDEIERIDDSQEPLAELKASLQALCRVGSMAIEYAMSRESNNDYQYFLPLGTQIPYMHNITADKFLYLCELRTGTGAHPQYAKRVREVLNMWHERFPQTAQYVQAGTAEPE